MPQPWVFDAAYTNDTGHLSFSSTSPQRHRRGHGILHFDLRGAATGSGLNSSGLCSPSQQASAAQWKSSASYKALGGSGSVGGGTSSDGHAQPNYSALVLSVLAAGNASPNAFVNALAGVRPAAPGPSSGASSAVLSSGCARSQAPSPSDAVGPSQNQLGQRTRQLPARPTAAGGFAISRMPGGQAVPGATGTASAAAGAAPYVSAGSGGLAAAAGTSWSLTYNPLLPRQANTAAGRRQPSGGEQQWPPLPPQPVPELLYPGSPGCAPSSPRGPTAQRRSTGSGAMQQNWPSPCSSISGGDGAAAGAADLLPQRVGAPTASAQAAAQRQPTHGGLLSQATAAAVTAAPPAPQLYGCHPEDLVTPVTAAVAAAVADGRSPRGGWSGGGGLLGGAEGSLGCLSGTGLGQVLGAGHLRSRSRFDIVAAAGDGGGSSGSAQGEAGVQRQAAGASRYDGMQYFAPSNNMQTAMAVLGVGAPSTPPGDGGGRGKQSVATAAAPPPPRLSSSELGAFARAYAPAPPIVVRSSVSDTDGDSALEFFGVYGDGESGMEEGEVGDEEGEDDEEEEEAGGSAGRSEGPAPRPARADSSARGIRCTASVHAVRRAVAATGSRAVPRPPSQQQRQPSPWSLQLPPSGTVAGRPPAGPLPPAGPALRRRSSGLGAATAAASVGLRDGASDAGSRPDTASSAWSSCDTLLKSGRGRSADSLSSTAAASMSIAGREGGGAGESGGGSRGGNAAAAACRRAASNPRDARTLLEVRCSSSGSACGGGDRTRGESLSRCNSATSRRAAGNAGGVGVGLGGTAAAQALALLATLALTSPPSPGGASVASSGGGAAAATIGLRKRLPSAMRGGRKTAGGAGGAPPAPRPLHPAVLALTEQVAAAAPPADPHQIPIDDKGRACPYLLPPAFPGTCPTIAFAGPAADKHGRGLAPLLAPTLYVKYGGVANTPVRTAFREAGLRPTRKGKRWLVQWGGLLDAAALAKLHCFQRVNHFPGTWELGHKGHLYRNVYNARRRARGPAADAFDIVPRFYLMPRDYEEFRADCERYPDRLYIQKPTNSSRGRGIRMVTRPDAISRDAKDVLVQHYIANPLLLNGFKFDMRVYAAATSLDPLRLYVFPDGLARLATEPYSADRADLSKRCVHLTNYSVNKKSANFKQQQQQQHAQPAQPAQPQTQVHHHPQTQTQGAAAAGSAQPPPPAAAASSAATSGSASAAPRPQWYSSRPADPAAECEGSKWSLSGLRHHLESRGQGPGWAAVWRQVCDIVAAAVIAAEPRMNTENKIKVPHRNNCFEVWGFDVMLTDTFRAWLIEANTCPSLAADSGLDMRVKCAMVSELMHLLGPVPYDVEVYERAAEAKRQARLTGLPVAVPARSAGEEERPGTASLGAQPSYGPQSGGGAGVSSGGSASGAVQPKSLHELDGIDFTALTPGELPDVVLEAEAEMARRGSWQRVFPSEEDPTRYLNLFETPRLNNVMLCKYYAQTGGFSGGEGELTLTVTGPRRPNSVSRGGARGTQGGLGSTGGSGGGGRPISREWRPGGGGG